MFCQGMLYQMNQYVPTILPEFIVIYFRFRDKNKLVKSHPISKFRFGQLMTYTTSKYSILFPIKNI